MSSAVTSPRLEAAFRLESLVAREDLQQDKKTALLATVAMFEEYNVPYVVTGGLAVQLYSDRPRNTNDVDFVSLRAAFRAIQSAQPWPQYGLELVFDRRRYIKVRHAASNVEIDINLDTRFARLLQDPQQELVEGKGVLFTSPLQIAFAKLRTQRSDWPRDPDKRYQDRTDLIRIFRLHPEVPPQLEADPMTTPEMQQILREIVREADLPQLGDELPSDDVPG